MGFEWDMGFGWREFICFFSVSQFFSVNLALQLEYKFRFYLFTIPQDSAPKVLIFKDDVWSVKRFR